MLIISCRLQSFVNFADTQTRFSDIANKGENPRVTKAMLDSYIDSEEVDIDELMEKTKDFLSKANATKKAVKEIMKEYEEQMAKKKTQEL